jgi:hypothetical protein
MIKQTCPYCEMQRQARRNAMQLYDDEISKNLELTKDILMLEKQLREHKHISDVSVSASQGIMPPENYPWACTLYDNWLKREELK